MNEQKVQIEKHGRHGGQIFPMSGLFCPTEVIELTDKKQEETPQTIHNKVPDRIPFLQLELLKSQGEMVDLPAPATKKHDAGDMAFSQWCSRVQPPALWLGFQLTWWCGSPRGGMIAPLPLHKWPCLGDVCVGLDSLFSGL